MKKVIIVALITCFGCLKEKNIDPGVPSTFVKYFNGGYNDVAQDIKSTSDRGYILLATSEARFNEVSNPRYKIKIIKTDEFGNLQWQKVYPEYDGPMDSISFRGRSLAILKDGTGLESGYVIVGDSIKSTASESHLRIMLTDLDGNITIAKNFKPSFAVQGKGVTINSNGNFVVLGAGTQGSNDMMLAELNQNLSLQWTREYSNGSSIIANRLFVDAQNLFYWSGTATTSPKSDIRFLRAPGNSESTERDLNIGDPDFNETGNDITPYGFGFAVIGTTDDSANGDDEIQFKRLAQDGRELASGKFGHENQADIGLSIASARDGGLILLGSMDTHVQADGTQIGRGGKDYFLIKVNAFGDEEWRQVFGSKNDDTGSKVLANADGSYVILGTTVWGGLRTVSLIKTDSKGQIN